MRHAAHGSRTRTPGPLSGLLPDLPSAFLSALAILALSTPALPADAAPAKVMAPPRAADLPRFSDSIIVVGEPVTIVPVPPDKVFEVAFKVGELTIEARPIADARLELRADCRDVELEACRRQLAKITLSTEELDDRIRVSLRGLSRRAVRKMGIHGTIVVPSRAPLRVKMGIGDLEIDAGPEDLRVTMGIGEVTIRARRDAVSRVGIATRIGDAGLHDGDHIESRRRFLGARVDWPSGKGEAQIDVKLKIGDAQVYLE